MSIRTRLVLSYIAILVIPTILSFMVVNIVSEYLDSVGSPYQQPTRENRTPRFSKVSAHFLKELETTAQSTPDKLLGRDYLAEIDRAARLMGSGIIVRKGGRNLYVSPFLDQAGILNQLPDFGAKSRTNSILPTQASLFLIHQIDFYYPDNSRGSLYVLTGNNRHRFFVTHLTLLLVIIMILILTNALLTHFVSRRILRPIAILREGLRKIKEGNLDFAINVNSRDEIGELCRDFEEMRCRLKESIDRQLRYEEDRKELIANISHDLKTPIAAIKGYTEGILDGVADSPEKMNKYIRTIHIKATDMDKLIEELFLYSKLDLRRETFNFEKVDIGNYLQHSIEDLVFDLDKRRIKLSLLTEGPEAITVIADREKVKRVISNIINNSVKFVDKNDGRIEIQLEIAPEMVTITIADNGPGMSREFLSMIFERFYRIEPSRNLATGGSGLGLAIARRIIEEHGGTIWAVSEIGKGTAVSFTLKRELMDK